MKTLLAYEVISRYLIGLAFPLALHCEPVAALTALGRTSASAVFRDGQVAMLAQAAADGNLHKIDELLASGVSVDAEGEKGMTPLTFAVLAANLEGVRELLKNHADPNHRIIDEKHVGGLPIILVLPKYNAAPLMDLLLTYGADPNTCEPPRFVSGKNLAAGDSLLISSVMSLENVRILLAHGADVNYRPAATSKSTGHASAAVVAAGLGQLDVLQLLIESGASDLDAIADALQGRTWSAAAKTRRNEILSLLKSKGARVYLRYKPVLSQQITPYPPQDTPGDLISPGYYEGTIR